MRLVAYTDYVYRQGPDGVSGERAFAVFLGRMAGHFDQLTVVGRLDPGAGPAHYPLPSSVRFVPLPFYSSLTRPVAVLASLWGSLRRFWGAIDDADRVWLLGPYPHAVAFAVIAKLRRRRLVLGVRQDFPVYVRTRRPNRRWMHAAAWLLELCWRALARSCPTVVVGPELESHYRHAPRLLNITVSLISDEDIATGERASTRGYDGELTLLSVGRLDREKNPLLLADALAELRRADPQWRMIVCGEGRMAAELRTRLQVLGLESAVELRGYVPIHDGLLELYRRCHVFLHVSLTEGVPQVLTEAFASGTPVVATAVGGVPAAVGSAAVLVEPGDAAAAAAAVERVATDTELRRSLIEAGFGLVRRHTLDSETRRVAEFIKA